MALILFLSKLIISSGLLYGYYLLFLRNKRFHRYNRFYLLCITLFSIVIPFINIPLRLFWGGRQAPGLISTLKVITASGWEEPVTVYAQQGFWHSRLSLQNGLFGIYLAGALAGLFLLLRSLAYISRLKSRYPYNTLEQLKIYHTSEPGTPFSFFKSVFWDKKIPMDDRRGRQIFRHELFHVKERHSADILLLEVFCCLGWFNPFFHLIKKELRAIHEFLADGYAISGNNRYEYAELLVLQAKQQLAPGLTHPFFHNQIKRRITMITQSNLVRRNGYFSRIMALPLLLLLVSAFAVKLTHPLPVNGAVRYANKTITVIIDPGHGGIFTGARNQDGVAEKDIDLSIAQKIKALSANYNVNIELTRNTDRLVGSAANLKEDLENRVAFSEGSHPDLFISIHVNATNEEQTTRSGFEAYISRNDADEKARALASTVLTGLKDIYLADENIKQREIGLYVLDHNKYPAIMIQCGYINNPADLLFITNPGNQDKIARKILEGIVAYSNRIGVTIADTVPATAQETAANNVVKVEHIWLMDTAAQPVQIRNERISDTNAAVRIVNIDFDKVTRQHDTTYTKVEEEAQYPGGNAGWGAYLVKSVRYPVAAAKKNIQGTVLVQFIVDQQGKITDVTALSGPEELKAESIRVVKESGNWTSALNNGKKVKSYKRQPIIYKLS